jgi:pilus assembly protein Flp/PilA
MRSRLKLLKDLFLEIKGATAIEYGLIASIVAIGIVIGATGIGLRLNTMLDMAAAGFGQ